MKNSYTTFTQHFFLFTILTFICFSVQAQVGVGTTTPDAELDIVTTAATGNALQINDENTTNVSSSTWIRNSGLGRGLNLQSINPANNIVGLEITQLGTSSNARGLDIIMDPASTATGLAVFQYGALDGIYSSPFGTGFGFYNQISGSGGGIYNLIQGTSIVGTIQDLTQNGGFGEYIDLGVQDGNGVLVNAVNNITTPTGGGDVFAFDGTVYTSTPTGAFINGAVLSGQQFGVGHGAIITHSGTAGRNAEFNITNPLNTDAAIFSIHLGRGSAIVAQNQNNVIVGTIAVADFAYTGTDVDDHIGVRGQSTPAVGWGIGVVGSGNWYGVFSNGNFGATGTKTFLIDHPADPANKMLKHFSIESNEVLNMYRGTEVFDANGKAIVHLPNYYDSINKNPAYQLTPIGAAMPNLYIESELNNGQFVIAGGVPNKKVSWQITAERNDPYLQQNPEQREVVITKEGPRSGKYLNPELYNQPKENGMFYNANNENLEASEIRKPDVKTIEKIKTERSTQPKIEPSEKESVEGGK